MKNISSRHAFGFVALGLALLGSSLRAQNAPAIPPLDETARLMQEYMARRAEWLELRRAALDEAGAAKSEREKKQRLDKLSDDEKPLLSRMGNAAQAYRAAVQQKRSQATAAVPTEKPRS